MVPLEVIRFLLLFELLPSSVTDDEFGSVFLSHLHYILTIYNF